MKHCTWKTFRRRQNLSGLWLDLAEPDPSGTEMRSRGKIKSVQWGRGLLTLQASFSWGMRAGNWRKLKKLQRRSIVFDLSLSKGGIRILGQRCFRWSSMEGRSCTTAPSFKGFPQLSPRPSLRSLCQKILEGN